MYQVIPLYVLYHGFAYMHFLYLIVSNSNVEERKWGQYYHRYHFNICNDCVRTACVRVGECIVDDKHNKQRLERQTTTFKGYLDICAKIYCTIIYHKLL